MFFNQWDRSDSDDEGSVLEEPDTEPQAAISTSPDLQPPAAEPPTWQQECLPVAAEPVGPVAAGQTSDDDSEDDFWKRRVSTAKVTKAKTKQKCKAAPKGESKAAPAPKANPKQKPKPKCKAAPKGESKAASAPKAKEQGKGASVPEDKSEIQPTRRIKGKKPILPNIIDNARACTKKVQAKLEAKPKSNDGAMTQPPSAQVLRVRARAIADAMPQRSEAPSPNEWRGLNSYTSNLRA